MSSATFSTTSRHARPSGGGLARLRASVAARRDAARGRRDLDSILAGQHGRSMRDELQSVRSRS